MLTPEREKDLRQWSLFIESTMTKKPLSEMWNEIDALRAEIDALRKENLNLKIHNVFPFSVQDIVKAFEEWGKVVEKRIDPLEK